VLAENGFGNLGFYSMGVSFFSVAVCSFISSNVVTKCGDRLALVGGSLTNSLYAATFILSSYYGDNPDLHAWYLKTFLIVIVYVAAVLNGFGASIIWLAQGKYVAQCASDSNKGLFNGTFWAILMFSNIVGCLMSAFLIGSVKNLSVFFSIMTIIMVLASFFFLILPKPTPIQ
jgi:hypothetical protein